MSKLQVSSRLAVHAQSEDSHSTVNMNRPPTRRYENTYHVGPDPCQEFSSPMVQRVCADILEATLETVQKYDKAEMGRLAVRLTATIKQAVKELNFPRYKIICNVIIGEQKQQGFQVVSRCVWDEKIDNYACAMYKTDVLYAVAIVHGIYFD